MGYGGSTLYIILNILFSLSRWLNSNETLAQCCQPHDSAQVTYIYPCLNFALPLPLPGTPDPDDVLSTWGYGWREEEA